MASSIVKHNGDWSKELSQSPAVVITERYFYLVFTKYGTPFPEDASWKETKKLNGHWQLVQEVASMLFEIADLFEDARVEELVKIAKSFASIVVIFIVSLLAPLLHCLTTKSLGGK